MKFGAEKLEWPGYRANKFWRYVYSFSHDLRTWRTDTDRQTDTAWRHRRCLCIASRGKNCAKDAVDDRALGSASAAVDRRIVWW